MPHTACLVGNVSSVGGRKKSLAFKAGLYIDQASQSYQPTWLAMVQ